MSLTLHAPTLADVEIVRGWRALVPETLRTPFPLTAEQQVVFYQDVVCDRRATSRFWSVVMDAPVTRTRYAGERVSPFTADEPVLVAWAGLEHISLENGHAEIGLIVDPARQRQGIGRQAVDLVLAEAFDRMRLFSVWGESYLTNARSADFWRAVVQRYHGSVTIWERRKFWEGQLFDALLFTLTVEGYRASKAAA